MLADLFLYTLICGISICFFIDSLGFSVIYFSLFFFFIYTVPVIIIHINYYENDKGTVYEFTHTGFIQKQKKTLDMLKSRILYKLTY